MNNFQQTLQGFAGKIQGNRYISAITNGLMASMPITMVGALGSLINSVPIQGYQDFLTSSGLKEFTAIPSEITTNLLAIYIVFLIASKFVESYELEGTSAGLLAVMALLIVTPFTFSERMSIESIPTAWLGAAGIFTAFFIGLSVGKIYSIFKLKGWVIKMPAGVPPTVEKSFGSMLPGFMIGILALVIRIVMAYTPFENIHQFIFGMIAAPLTRLGGSFPAMVIAIVIGHILWFVGVHGTMVVYSVFAGIWTPLTTANLAAFNAGQEIPNLISSSLFSMAMFMGSGATLGLVLLMMRGKAEQHRMLGKLVLIPNICGINEPILFGLPIIMNFTLVIPFVIMPTLICVLSYAGMVTGILPPLTGVGAPLGTPVILQGLMTGGWQWSVFQAIMIVVSYFVYLPFFRIADKLAYQKELETAGANTTEAALSESVSAN